MLSDSKNAQGLAFRPSIVSSAASLIVLATMVMLIVLFGIRIFLHSGPAFEGIFLIIAILLFLIVCISASFNLSQKLIVSATGLGFVNFWEEYFIEWASISKVKIRPFYARYTQTSIQLNKPAQLRANRWILSSRSRLEFNLYGFDSQLRHGELREQILDHNPKVKFHG